MDKEKLLELLNNRLSETEELKDTVGCPEDMIFYSGQIRLIEELITIIENEH